MTQNGLKLLIAIIGVLTGLVLASAAVTQAQEPGAASAGSEQALLLALAQPSLQSPTNSASVAQQPVVFAWSTVSGANKYQLQVALKPNMDNRVINQQGITGLSYTSAKALTVGKTYYWRVRGVNGSNGPWSAVHSFTVAEATTNNNLIPGDLTTRVPYVASSPWNTPIGANPVYDPNSVQMIATLGQTSTGGRIGSDATRYTYPVYFADANTRRVDIPCLKYKCTIVANGTTTRVEVMRGIPVPVGAKPSAGTDGQMIIIDQSTGIEYGFWQVTLTASGGYTASNGYQYHLDYDATEEVFGSRGAGVPYYAGLIRPWEIRAGVINHALAFAYDAPISGKCVWPASKTDGPSTNPYAMPEGARIQLNPNLTEADFDRMGLSRAGKIIARALQQYGMYLIDTGGSPKIMVENLVDNPLDNTNWSDADLALTNTAISNIPYQEFRVLALPAAYWNSSAPTALFGNCINYP